MAAAAFRYDPDPSSMFEHIIPTDPPSRTRSKTVALTSPSNDLNVKTETTPKVQSPGAINSRVPIEIAEDSQASESNHSRPDPMNRDTSIRNSLVSAVNGGRRVPPSQLFRSTSLGPQGAMLQHPKQPSDANTDNSARQAVSPAAANLAPQKHQDAHFQENSTPIPLEQQGQSSMDSLDDSEPETPASGSIDRNNTRPKSPTPAQRTRKDPKITNTPMNAASPAFKAPVSNEEPALSDAPVQQSTQSSSQPPVFFCGPWGIYNGVSLTGDQSSSNPPLNAPFPVDQTDEQPAIFYTPWEPIPSTQLMDPTQNAGSVVPAPLALALSTHPASLAQVPSSSQGQNPSTAQSAPNQPTGQVSHLVAPTIPAPSDTTVAGATGGGKLAGEGPASGNIAQRDHDSGAGEIPLPISRPGEGKPDPTNPLPNPWDLQGPQYWHENTESRAIVTLDLKANPKTSELKEDKEYLKLVPKGVESFVNAKKSFFFSFQLGIASEARVIMHIRDDPFDNFLRAVFNPTPGVADEGTLDWLQNDGQLHVLHTDPISLRYSTTVKIFYSYSETENWSLVVFQGDKYVTNMDWNTCVLRGPERLKPNPGLAFELVTADAPVKVQLSDLKVAAVAQALRAK